MAMNRFGDVGMWLEGGAEKQTVMVFKENSKTFIENLNETLSGSIAVL